MNTQNYNVNLRVGIGIAPKVRMSQGDVGRELAFNIYDGVARFSPPSSAVVKIKGTKPSGLGFNVACVLSGNVASVLTTLDMTQESGAFPVELEISNGNTVIGTANFAFYIEPSPHPDGTTDGTTEEARTVLEQCKAYAELAQEAAEAASGDYTEIRSDVDDLTDRVEALESGSGDSGLTDAVKTALMDLVSHIGVWTDDSGQDYIDNLYDALYPAVPPADLVSISAVYTQSGTVYDTDTLNSLKDDLVVTATLSDQTTQTVTGYTLSGTLTVGTSTITVSYGGKTTTFNVTVSEKQKTYLYNWDLTESLTDTVSEQTITLNCASGKSNAVQDENGLTFNDATQNAYLGTIDMVGKTIEIDVESMLFKGNTSHHIRFLMNAQYTNSTGYGLGSLVWKSGLGWASYGWTSETGSTRAWSANTWGESLTGTTSEIINALSGKTVKVVYGSDGHTQKLYLDDVLIGTLTDIWFNTTGTTHYSNKIFIGGMNSVNKDQGDQCYDMTITGIRIYENEVA